MTAHNPGESDRAILDLDARILKMVELSEAPHLPGYEKAVAEQVKQRAAEWKNKNRPVEELEAEARRSVEYSERSSRLDSNAEELKLRRMRSSLLKARARDRAAGLC